MSYIDLDEKDVARMLSIMSEYFGNKDMTVADTRLRKKLEAMHQAEIDWNKD